jgi:outer membrane protein TolC
MKPRTFAAAALVLATVALPARGQQEGGVLSLSLEECILRAMKGNLSVAIQVLNPEIAGAAVTQAGEKFYPTLSLGFNKRNTDSASYSGLDAAGSVVTRVNDYTLDFNQTVPGAGPWAWR